MGPTPPREAVSVAGGAFGPKQGPRCTFATGALRAPAKPSEAPPYAIRRKPNGRGLALALGALRASQGEAVRGGPCGPALRHRWGEIVSFQLRARLGARHQCLSKINELTDAVQCVKNKRLISI